MLHNSYPVFNLLADDELRQQITIKQEKIGVDSYNISDMQSLKPANETIAKTYTLDEVQANDLLTFFIDAQGKANEFYLPSFLLDAKIIAINTPTYIFCKSSLANYYEGITLPFALVRDNAIIYTFDALVGQSNVNNSTEATLTLTASPAITFKLGDMIVPLKLARFDIDELEIPLEVPKQIQLTFFILEV